MKRVRFKKGGFIKKVLLASPFWYISRALCQRYYLVVTVGVNTWPGCFPVWQCCGHNTIMIFTNKLERVDTYRTARSLQCS